MAGETRTHGQPLRANDPEQLGPYRLLRRLGEGGMGSVYLAEDSDGHRVALKIIRSDLADEPEFRRRFRSEVARAQEVPPFCTAEVLDADPDHETPYLVVEFVDGPSLSEVVLDRGPLTPSNLHGLAIGVATALTAIHSAGVIHRDLKPSNVLLAPGSPKVIDFGIARAAESTDSDTRTDQLIGTVAYMAPERLDPATQRPLTSAADVFAWGAVVAFAATGRLPFMAESSPATAVAILTREPDLEGLTEPLRSLVARALAKDPKERPTARELLDELLTRAPRANGTKRASVTGDAVTDEHLTSGVAAAQVDIAKQPADKPKKRDRTRVGKPDDVIATEVVPRPGSSAMRRFGVSLLVVAVLALAATLVEIVRGDISLPLRAAAQNHPSLSPTPTPAPSVSVSADPNNPFPGSTPFIDSFGKVSEWTPRDVDPARCIVDGGLSVQLRTVSTYRCPGKVDQYTDFRVIVNITIVKPGSCPAVWFRLTGTGADPKGYALQVCAARVVAMRHFTTRGKTYTEPLETAGLPLERQLKTGITYALQITQIGTRMIATLNGQSVIDTFNDRYPSGRIVLGIFQSPPLSDPTNNTPSPNGYEVRFDHITIYAPQQTETTSSPVGSPSPAGTP